MKLKKIGLTAISMLMLFSTGLSNLSIVNAKQTDVMVREYETGYKTDKGTNLLKLRVKSSDIPNYDSHWGQVAFCVEHGEKLPTGQHSYDSNAMTETYKNAARVAYLATYRYNNGESGGMKRYAYTQNLIWQVLGQAPNSYNIDADYPTWKTKIMDEYNKWDTMPSFDGTTIRLGLGASKTVADKNKVLKYYDAFEFTKDGVTFSHTKNSNNIVITASENCTKATVIVTDTDSKNNGASKYSQSTGKANFVLKSSGVQDMICSPGFTDPRFLSLQVQLDLYGSLEIAKKDNKGNLVPNVTFKVSNNADMSNPIGTYTTAVNGKVLVEKIKPSTVYVQETKVPEHLILDNTVHKIVIKSNATTTFTATNNWKQGYIQVVKKDNKTGQVVKQSGVEFEVLKGNAVIETIKTNLDGYAKTSLLDYGTYVIREKKEPTNYTIATLTQEQAISENGKVYEVTMFNEPVIGQIKLSKEDKETGKVSQGDAQLKGASYTLKADETIKNPADQSIIYEKGEVVSVKNIGNSSYGDIGKKVVDNQYNITWKNLPLGRYIIEETKVPEGYLIDGTHTVTLEKTSSTKDLEVRNVISKEQVMKGQLEVTKAGSDGSSGVVDSLQGVEFTMKLKSEVDKIGWDKAKTYSTIVTDSKGRGISQKIPYGLYQVKETKTPSNYAPSGDFFVNINEDKEIEYRMVNNAPFKAWLKLVKVDEKGNKVTLSGATFKIKDSKGNYVTQKVGLFFEKDEWTTDKNGMVALDDMILHGHYTIEEVKAPNGFLLGNSFDFEVSANSSNLEFDKDMDAILTVKFKNEKSTGEIILNKTFENAKDKDGVVFKLTAVNDVINATDGSILYKKGQIVAINGVKDGHYEIKNGKIMIKGLPLNPTGKTSYQLEEVKTLDGYVLLDKPIVYDFDIKDSATKVYTITQEAHNKLTETYFSKEDINGQEIKGGLYQVIDKESNQVIDEWTSDGSLHLVKGLVMGKDYIFRENLAPAGYTLAQDIQFTMKNNQTIVMKDTIVEMNKLDVNDKSVEGATIQVISNKTKDIVDQWITDGTPHKINKLIVGESYTAIEVKTPKGYVTANPIEFTVSLDGNQTFNMIDKKVTFSKVDVGGEEVEGANMSVVDKETGKVVDQWVSEKEVHEIDNLIIGKEYILREDLAPLGYNFAQDIPFVVTDEKDNQHIEMVDTITTIHKLDENHQDLAGSTLQITSIKTKNIVDEWVSDGTAHQANGLLSGETYELREVKAPEGYIKADPEEFTVSSTDNQIISLTNKSVKIFKIDQNNKPVEGAKLKIIDRDTNEVVEEWTTNDTGEYFASKLQINGKYQLVEVETPDHYLSSASIDFEVSPDKNQEIIMTDIKTDIVEISKKDATNHEELEGAKLQIIDKDGNIVEEWISTKEPHLVQLTVSSKYTLVETLAPSGYEIAESITFEVDDNSEVVQKVEMLDKRTPTVIVKTSDNTTIGLYILGLVIASSGMIYYVYKKRKGHLETE